MSDTLTTTSTTAAQGPRGKGADHEARLRLRRVVRSRSLSGRGVAISAGHSAVVVDGAAAEILWAAVESTLRSGCTLTEVRDRLPAQAREAMVEIWGQLVDHDLLCAASKAISAGPLTDHFERVAPDPERAMDRLERSTGLLLGDPAMVRATADALADTGIRTVRAPHPGDDGMDVIGDGMAQLLIDVGGSSEEESRSHAVLAIRVGGWRLVGRRPDTPRELAALRAWANRLKDDPTTSRVDESSSGRAVLADSLAGAQVVLEALRLIAQGASSSASSYLVTTPDVVAEKHTLPTLPDAVLHETPIDLDALARTAVATIDIDERLRRLESLWLGPLAPWSGPVPGDLPQLPLGLATAARGSATVLGIGLTTAEARLSCVEQLAEEELGMPVGRDPLQAAAQAVLAWAAPGSPQWGDARGVAPDTSAFTRRLTQALTLREGVDVRARATVVATGLVQVAIHDDSENLLGMGVGVSSAGAHEEALLEALGNVLASRAGSVRASGLRVRTESVARELVAWAHEHGVEVGAPTNASAWTELGLHPRHVLIAPVRMVG